MASAFAGPDEDKWDHKEILQIIDEKKFDGKYPYFRFDVKAIQDTRKSFKSANHSDTPERPHKQARLDHSRAQCALTIWEGQGTDYQLVNETVGCSITPIARPNSEERYAKVELDKPFQVYCQDLVPRSGRPLTAQRYSMQIALQAESIDTKWPPVNLDEVPPPQEPTFTDGDGSEIPVPLLVIPYTRFPQCPSKEEEALVRLNASQDGRRYKPKLSLQIDAKWLTANKESEKYEGWQRYRKSNRSKGPAVAKKVPSRAVQEPPPGLPALRVATTWKILHRRFEVARHSFTGLVCPLCDNKLFADSNYYYLHLINDHDLFKFEMTTKHKFDKQPSAHVKVKVAVSDSYETGQDGSKKGEGDNFSRTGGGNGVKETLVLRNFDTFFDLQRYLQGVEDKNWGKGRSRDRPSNALLPSSRSDSAFESGRATPTAAPVDLTRPASRVPDLAPPQRKKYPVPAAPEGVIFFSLRVKRPLTEGELLSESDDEIDDEWLLEKQETRIDSFENLTMEEKSFMKRHDRHMLKENVNNNLHYREALIRFCRINSQWLKRADVRREFAKKLTALQLEGVIHMQQIFDCMNIINRPDRNNQQAKTEDNILAIEEDTVLSPTASSRRLYSHCAVCHGPIRALLDIVRCANPACLNDCHLMCYDRLFGRDPQETEQSSLCIECRNKPREEPARAHNNLSEAGMPLRTSGPTGSEHGQRPLDVHAQERRTGFAGEDQSLINYEGSENSGLSLLDRLAPDHLSRLPNERNEAKPGHEANGTLALPYTIVDDTSEEDFPVGRDRSRIRQSQIMRGINPFDSSDFRERGIDRRSRRDRDTIVPRFDPRNNEQRYTSEDATMNGVRPPIPRRPHEL